MKESRKSNTVLYLFKGWRHRINPGTNSTIRKLLCSRLYLKVSMSASEANDWENNRPLRIFSPRRMRATGLRVSSLSWRTAERTLDFPLYYHFSMENCLSFRQGRETLVSTGVYHCPPFACIYSQSFRWLASFSFFAAVVVYYSYSRAFVNFLAKVCPYQKIMSFTSSKSNLLNVVLFLGNPSVILVGTLSCFLAFWCIRVRSDSKRLD